MTYIEKLWEEYGEYDDDGAYFMSYDFFELAINKAMQAQREACLAALENEVLILNNTEITDRFKHVILNAEVSNE